MNLLYLIQPLYERIDMIIPQLPNTTFLSNIISGN